MFLSWLYAVDTLGDRHVACGNEYGFVDHEAELTGASSAEPRPCVARAFGRPGSKGSLFPWR
jgi:hypothetical protein